MPFCIGKQQQPIKQLVLGRLKRIVCFASAHTAVQPMQNLDISHPTL